MATADETVTQDEIAADLRDLGLEAGDEVVVHSSLSSMGWVEGGPDTVIDALRSVVGDQGTVVVPASTAGLARRQPFVPAETPSQTGAVTEALRTRPGAQRSRHPTHSIAALGPGAPAITRDHAYDRSLGIDSPLHRVAKRGGKVLLIGVGHDRNSTIHVAERLAELPYKTGAREALVQTEEGEETVEVARVGCSKGFPDIEPVADDAGVLSHGHIGAAAAQLMGSAEIIDVALEMLDEDPACLLCDEPDCWWCPDARDRLRAAGALD